MKKENAEKRATLFYVCSFRLGFDIDYGGKVGNIASTVKKKDEP